MESEDKNKSNDKMGSITQNPSTRSRSLRKLRAICLAQDEAKQGNDLGPEEVNKTKTPIAYYPEEDVRSQIPVGTTYPRHHKKSNTWSTRKKNNETEKEREKFVLTHFSKEEPSKTKQVTTTN